MDGFQIMKKSLIVGEEAEVVERGKGALEVVENPEIRLEHEQAGPGRKGLLIGGEGMGCHFVLLRYVDSGHAGV